MSDKTANAVCFGLLYGFALIGVLATLNTMLDVILWISGK